MHDHTDPRPQDSALDLRAFLDHPSRPYGALSYLEAHGFLFTVAAAPDLVPPSEWIPVIFGGAEPAFADKAQAGEIIGQLFALYNELTELTTGQTVRPSLPFEFRDDALANLEDDAPACQWSRGFHLGHSWLEESWPEETFPEFDDELGACLFSLSFFSSRKLAERFVRECAGRKQSPEEVAENCRRVFPDAMVSYALLAQACRRAAVETMRASVVRPSRSERVGRNDPCPCGSGKKYKKCCQGKTAHEHGPDCDHGPTGRS